MSKALLGFILFLTLSSFIVSANADEYIEVLNYKSYVDTDGHFWIIGEIQSTRDENLELEYVWATFYDTDGEVMSTLIEAPVSFMVKSDMKVPFYLHHSNASQMPNFATYDINFYLTPTSYTTYTSLSIQSHANSTDTLGNLLITGDVVVGTLKEPIRTLKVIVTGYNSFNEVVAIGSHTIRTNRFDSIKSGETVSFSISIPQDRAKLVTHYTLFAEAIDSTSQMAYYSTTIPEFPLQITPFTLIIATFLSLILFRSKTNVFKNSSTLKR